MAATWLPKEVAARLLERPHELENVRATYLLSTGYVAGFLGREDGARPAWLPRAHLMPASTLTPDVQHHLAATCHAICLKVRQEATNAPRQPGINTRWQGALHAARVLWRTIFAAAAAKAPVSQAGLPVLYMTACESLKQASRLLLTQLWLEVQQQFTSKLSKYRNIKSRPEWSTLEAMQFKVFGTAFGFGINDPALTPSPPVSKPAANLQDFLEEVLALRFAVDWLSGCQQDAEEFMEQATKRLLKRGMLRQRLAGDPVEAKLLALKAKSAENFGLAWTDDAELRGVASLSARLMDTLEGPSALHFAGTFAGKMLLAIWQGLHPMLAHHASAGIAHITEMHSTFASLPPPPLEDEDEDKSQTAVFDRIALSHLPASRDCRELIRALPRSVAHGVVKVQAVFRGHVFRKRYFMRSRAVASYCQAARWPQLEAPREGFDDVETAEDKKDRRRKRAAAKGAKKAEVQKLKEEMSEPSPVASRPLLGAPPPTSTKVAVAAGRPGAGGSQHPASPHSPLSPVAAPAGSPLRTTRSQFASNSTAVTTLSPDRRSWPLPTADHRACADLFALYVYNMYRRRELTRMWQTLCGAYERGMNIYSGLLKKNPALKPMLESIAAQLKRGSVVGYDKAFIGKQRKEGDVTAALAKKAPSADMFASSRRLGGASHLGASSSAQTLPRPGGGDAGAAPGASSTMRPSSSMTALPKMSKGQTEAQAGDPYDISGAYLANYLKEMDGDDSQFKDISPAVIPLSTGTSPPRQPAQESVLKEAAASSSRRPSDESGHEEWGNKGPTVDVRFCCKAAKPIWLPIKAHRFAAYRAKVLQMLPESLLQEYIDLEKQGQYLSCMKLLESANPGSLNVLNPVMLVGGKPLLVETVLQLIVGYSGLCLKNQQGAVAVKLITSVIDNISLSLHDMHPGHRTVLEAYLFDTALSICYYMPNDIAFSDRAESFFQQASERYLRLQQHNRYCKACLRAAAVLHSQGNGTRAEYYTQQALNKLADAPVSSLLAVTHHNLAVHTLAQRRFPDAVGHAKAYSALLKQLPKLGNTWMQQMDNTQWLVLKVQELVAKEKEERQATQRAGGLSPSQGQLQGQGPGQSQAWNAR